MKLAASHGMAELDAAGFICAEQSVEACMAEVNNKDVFV